MGAARRALRRGGRLRSGESVDTNLRIRQLWNRLRPDGWMRRDWDRRARERAEHFIACGQSESDAAFWASGQGDLGSLVLQNLDLDSTAHALEIGCGLGRLLRPLSARVARAIGVDISPEMIERARRALADCPNVELHTTRGLLPMVPKATLDFVYSFIVFQHIPTKSAVSRYFREAARVLKGDGVFRFQVDGRPRGPRSSTDTWLGVWYKPLELAKELQAKGFDEADLWGAGTHYFWVTARRRPERGRVATSAVRIRRKRWNEPALAELLRRMGVDPAVEARAVLAGQTSLRQLAERFLQKHCKEDTQSFVRRAYEVFLGRPADEGGLAFYSKEIGAGIPPSHTINCLLSSAELESKLRVEMPDAPLG